MKLRVRSRFSGMIQINGVDRIMVTCPILETLGPRCWLPSNRENP